MKKPVLAALVASLVSLGGALSLEAQSPAPAAPAPAAAEKAPGKTVPSKKTTHHAKHAKHAKHVKKPKSAAHKTNPA